MVYIVPFNDTFWFSAQHRNRLDFASAHQTALTSLQFPHPISYLQLESLQKIKNLHMHAHLKVTIRRSNSVWFRSNV